MTQESNDPIRELAGRIVKQLDLFEIHLISYQDKVRRALMHQASNA